MQLADWIEQQNWQYFVENDTMMKCELIQRFSIEIKNLIEMSNDVAYRYKLVNYWNMITNSNADIHAIIKNIHDCLSYEKEFIRCNNQEVSFTYTEFLPHCLNPMFIKLAYC